MIRVELSARIQKTAETLPDDVRVKAAAALRAVAEGFGNPHAHTGLGIRKLGKRSYEVRVHLHWRIVLIHTEGLLTAYDVMNHDQVRQWLKRRK